MIPTPHRARFHAGHASASHGTPFPAYLVRDSDHVPDIEMMMERHRVVKMGEDVAWLENMTIQRTVSCFVLYAKLSDARQMAHHPEYADWVREALPLDEALGPGWRLVSESDVHEMLGDVPAK